MRSRLRVAVDYARMQGLIPMAKKEEKAESDMAYHAQVNDISPEERRKHSKDHNVACLATFVDVLVGLACDKWRERQEITMQSLRQGLMEKEKVEVKGYWEKLTGKQLFQYVWKFKNAGERKVAREYAEQRSYAIKCDVVLSAFDQILTVADEGEMAERIRGGLGSRPSRTFGAPAKAMELCWRRP